jgi:DNA repair ATPase RecN
VCHFRLLLLFGYRNIWLPAAENIVGLRQKYATQLETKTARVLRKVPFQRYIFSINVTDHEPLNQRTYHADDVVLAPVVVIIGH